MSRAKGRPTRYGLIRYGSRGDEYPGGTVITYSAKEHREALQRLRAKGWRIFEEQ